MNSDIAVIFDMDGVICHTNPYHSLAFREFFAAYDLAPTEAEFAEHMFGKSNSYILSHFFKRQISGEEFLRMEEEKEGLFRKIYADHVEPIAGILEFMTDLRQHGVPLGVATSAPRANLDLILSKLPVAVHMGSMLASEDVKKHKPDPEVYLKSAANLGISPERCVVFEDSFSGASAGLNAGMKVVGVLSSHEAAELPPCQLYVNDYRELSYAQLKALF